MAIVIPDLFGAFQKGREYAIDRNWKDLENYETIEKMRTANDMAQLALLQERYYTPLKMSMFGDNADNSAMQNQIQFTAYPGALSNARQFTNQAVSDEAVQAATLPDTAQTQVATTLANNRVARGEATEKSAYAGSVDWGGKGKANAAVTNFKAGKALSNAELDQVVFELQRAVQKGEAGKVLFELGLDKATRPQQEELARLVADGKIEEAKQYLVNLKNGTPTDTGNNGQAINFVNPAYKNYTNEALGSLIDNHTELVNNPKTTDASKAVSKDIIRAAKKELADRGVDITNGNNLSTGWGLPSISDYNPYNRPGNLTIDYRPRDEQGRLLFDYGAGLSGQGQPGVGVLVNPPNYTGFVGNNNPLGVDLSRYTDPANFATSPQNLTGDVQPMQTTKLVGGDINTYLESVENDSSISEPLRKAKLSAGILERDSSLFNNWGGIFGEKDQPVRNILVNGAEIPISNQTLDMLNSLNTKALTSNQLAIKNALLNNRLIQKTELNGRVEFVPNQLIPLSNNNYKYSYTPNYSSSNPIYR